MQLFFIAVLYLLSHFNSLDKFHSQTNILFFFNIRTKIFFGHEIAIIFEYQFRRLLNGELTNSNVCFSFQLKCLFGSFCTSLESKMDIREVNLVVRTNANIALKEGFFENKIFI